jgi:hypothetical protein
MRLASAKSAASRSLITRVIKSGRIPRLAFQHYFIEDSGLHSRVHLQNFYSTFWPHIEEPVEAHIDAYDAAGTHLGRTIEAIPHFGSLFLEASDLLAVLGSDATEGSIAIDLVPPPAALKELAAFPIPDPWALLLSSPFWMAYYDDNENYMYVHSIDRFAGSYLGVPGPMSWALGNRFGGEGASWRAGRLIDISGLNDFQIVITNHGHEKRSPLVTLRDGPTDETLWSTTVELPAHGLQRLHVDLDTLRGAAHTFGASSFRVGVDPLPTANGKPYVLMRYGDGPLSLHHG